MDPQHGDRLHRATDSLRESLESLEFVDLSSPAATRLITDQVAAWATKHGFRVATEVEAVAWQWRGRRQIGYLDLLATHPSGQQVAVEIDLTNNVWSIEKLAGEADTGKLAIWIKWGGPARFALIPEKIGVIELPARLQITAGHHMWSRTTSTTRASSVIGGPPAHSAPPRP